METGGGRDGGGGGAAASEPLHRSPPLPQVLRERHIPTAGLKRTDIKNVTNHLQPVSYYAHCMCTKYLELLNYLSENKI